MVSKRSVEQQLKQLGFNHQAWGRAEIGELPKIMLPDEEIYECVNGFYEGGFALLVATDVRVLLIDKKPMNYLTVEDLRFDMINEIDYGHRLFGAHIIIATGSKNLRFRSYNQARLRKLIGHVQHCMAEAKKKQSEHQEGQNQHLGQINQQLQTYLIAQHQQQERLRLQLEQAQLVTGQPIVDAEPVRPGPELSDYLFAQSLLAQHQAQLSQTPAALPEPAQILQPLVATPGQTADSQQADLYTEGLKEVLKQRQPATQSNVSSMPQSTASNSVLSRSPLEINALRIAYSRLPMALRNRRFGRPSFHAHSQADVPA